jgi:putative phosphoribosyl transferase
MFRNREDAGAQLAERLKGRPFRDPLVLAIPRGGAVVGAALARTLSAELDVVLARKLRAPGQPELAIGAVSESGEIHFNQHADELIGDGDDYFALEKQRQVKEIDRRNRLLRKARPQAPIEGRSVIVTDDGIATGSTMIAALKEIRLHKPYELVVAVPVAAPGPLELVRIWSDDAVCLLIPEHFWAVGQYYAEFSSVEDEQVVALLRQFKPTVSEQLAPAVKEARELGAGN